MIDISQPKEYKNSLEMFDESSLVEPKDLLRFFHGFVTGF